MIYLKAATKFHFSEDKPPRLVFKPTTLALPTDRRVAILGERLQGKSSLLRLLAGVDTPDDGHAVIPPLHFSPIVNPGRFFNFRLSGLENIRLIGRLMGIDANRLVLAVNDFCKLGPALERQLRYFTGVERQLLEISLLSVLTFDCYLLDNAHTVPVDVLERCFEVTGRRGGGMIFTTMTARLAHKFADYAVVVRDQAVHAYNHVEEAIESYERKAG
jgi:ABC-type polysaccharide/polyol phosphate transport system ATPase subunit